MALGCENTFVQPQLSVVLPVFNGMPFLRDAMASIRSQTFENFEIVVLDNGSEDGSLEYLQKMALLDSRIVVHAMPRPLGMVGSSNAVVALAAGSIVARMDADDVADRLRLEMQLRALIQTKGAVLVGCLAEGIDARGARVRPRDRSLILTQGRVAPIAHGSIMFDRKAFELAGGYREGTEGFEDQDLYHRIGRIGKLLALSDPPHQYRFHLQNWTAEYLENYGSLALVPLSAQKIWSGTRAPWLPWKVIRTLGFRAGMQALLYCSWGALSPKSLRRILSAIIVIKDSVSGARLRWNRRTQPFEWTLD